jgi:hypothetical protein
MVCEGAPQVAVLTPPQSWWSMQGLRMCPGFEQVQALPLPTSSIPRVQTPVCQVWPPQVQVPDEPLLRAVAMAWTVVGSVQETPVVSNVPEIVMDVHPVASSVVRHVSHDVHWLVAGGDPPTKASEYVGAGHTTVSHEPETQASPREQGVPHVPQLSGSLERSTHVPAHTTRGEAHVGAHEPESHTWPASQAASQAPQLSRSLERSRHVPEQSVNPPGHDAVQAPS